MGLSNPIRDRSGERTRIGTRGSPLALWQASQAVQALKNCHPGLEVETVVIKTSGDSDQTTPLDDLPSTGYFTKELEEALIQGRIDMAVHSLKDMAARVEQPFQLAAVLPRGPAGDVLVLHPRIVHVNDLPDSPTFLTGSVRRAQQLRAVYPGCRTQAVRGNIHTRLRKLTDGDAHGLVMAEAALMRLEITGYLTRTLPLDKVVPAPGQGAIALETLANREDLVPLLQPLESAETRRATDMERQLAYLLEGGCSLPLGAHASPLPEGGDLLFRASLSPDSKSLPVYQHMQVGPGISPAEAAETLARRVRGELLPAE